MLLPTEASRTYNLRLDSRFASDRFVSTFLNQPLKPDEVIAFMQVHSIIQAMKLAGIEVSSDANVIYPDTVTNLGAVVLEEDYFPTKSSYQTLSVQGTHSLVLKGERPDIYAIAIFHRSSFIELCKQIILIRLGENANKNYQESLKLVGLSV